jgi:hypothetical protein
MTMDATQMQQVLRNYGHSDARAAIEGKQSYEWERALRGAGFDDAAVVVTKFVPPQPKLDSLPTTGATSADGKPGAPAGSAPLENLDQWEALPQAERLARMDEADWLCEHEKLG